MMDDWSGEFIPPEIRDNIICLEARTITNVRGIQLACRLVIMKTAFYCHRLHIAANFKNRPPFTRTAFQALE
jgi:hypothetical protein